MTDLEIAEQAIEVHNTLWNPVAEIVEYNGRHYTIVRKREPTKKFTMVDFPGGKRYVTQNLALGSDNSAWCRENPRNKITWVLSDVDPHSRERTGYYSGQIISDGKTYKVIKLRPGPETVIYTRPMHDPRSIAAPGAAAS